MPKSRFTVSRMLMRIRRVVRNDQLVLSVLALIVGIAAGGAVILFREGINLFQRLFFQSDSELLDLAAASLPWWQIVLVPTAGGLLVGLFVRYFMPERRPHGLSDAIEASALRGGRMSAATGIKAAFVSALSIGAGASVGREGPAVHLGASLGAWLAERLHLTRSLSRTLLGCGAAAAVAASFNAPLAAALFANEVVIGHYALKTFAPVVIASVTGTAVSRAYFGAYPAFVIDKNVIASLWEFPAFVGLGIVGGLVAIILMRGIALANRASEKMPVPAWCRPAVAGLIVGAIAVAFPQVLGVGYGATSQALAGHLVLWVLVGVAAAKIIATAISLGFGFGGGIFSPSLMIGAMVGGAYGMIATQIFPDHSSGPEVYTIIGMGAVASAVLGAPISTTLIVFEMTGDWELTMAVIVTVVVAAVVTQQIFGKSFFAWQLEKRGLDLQGGLEAAHLRSVKVRDVMSRDSEVVATDMKLQALRDRLQQSPLGKLFVVKGGVLAGTVTLADLSEVAFDHDFDDLVNAGDVARLHPPILSADDDLGTALKVMRETGEEHIAVVQDHASMTFLGCLHERDAMQSYNRALLESRREERGI
jgi:CIC family chloride channel protein